MYKFTFCCVLLTAFRFGGVQGKHRYFNDSGKIVGGNETTIEAYPYQAYLLLYDGQDYYQCGGSIISKFYIVTAAHCLPRIQKIFVRIGSTTAGSGGTEYETTTFYSHPKYNSATSDYDAGVVKVPDGMNLDGTNARAISMVDKMNDPREGDNVILTGWGSTSQGGSTSSTLMVVQVPVVSRIRCNAQLRGGITTRMFCAGLKQGGKDTCQGDSGGPAVIKSSNKLAGITSFGYGCAQPNAPGVYARVGNPEIRSFIKNITQI